MSDFDISKLTAAPWTVESSCAGDLWGFDIPELPEASYRDSRFGKRADVEFIALARNAFDVMMRRGWSPIKGDDGWYAIDQYGTAIEDTSVDDWPDPFTAIIEADKEFTAKGGSDARYQ